MVSGGDWVNAIHSLLQMAITKISLNRKWLVGCKAKNVAGQGREARALCRHPFFLLVLKEIPEHHPSTNQEDATPSRRRLQPFYANGCIITLRWGFGVVFLTIWWGRWCSVAHHLMFKVKGVLFNPSGQTGKDCLFTWVDVVKVADC